MRCVRVLAIVGVFCLFLPSSQAQDAARKLIEKSVAAQGDEAKLAQAKGQREKRKGVMHIGDAAIPFTGEVAAVIPDRLLFDIVLEVGDNKAPFQMAYGAGKGWMKTDDEFK